MPDNMHPGFMQIPDGRVINLTTPNDIQIVASELNDGVLYGRVNNDLWESTNEGASWSLVQAGVGPIDLMLPTQSGEVMAAAKGSGVLRSSGWQADKTTAVFSQVLATGAECLSWGLSTDEKGQWVATHYSAGDYTASRYIWHSDDDGDTWAVILDLDDYLTGLGVAESQHHHIHFVSIDPFTNRIWTAWHSSSTPQIKTKAVMCTEDQGQTWVQVSTEWQPTTGTGTKQGFVLGTDSGGGGCLIARHKDDINDLTIEMVCPLAVESSPTAHVFSVYSQYIKEHGLVIIAFISQVDGCPAFVIASDGVVASVVYASAGQPNANGFREFIVLGDNIYFRSLLDNAGTNQRYITKMPVPVRGHARNDLDDPGRLMGGFITPGISNPYRSVAGGTLAEAGLESATLGHRAKAGTRSVTFGDHAESRNNALAMGREAFAESQAMAIW